MHPPKDDSSTLRHPRRTGGASLRVLLALGIAAACGPRIIDEDEEPKFRRCLYVVGTGVTADGERRRTDYNRSPTHQLCTCATDEEALDFSPGGYKEYINELAFEYCKELVEQAEILDDSCQETYDRNEFALTYGHGPNGEVGSDLPLCDEDVAAGCQG